jgi:hypothetical protein
LGGIKAVFDEKKNQFLQNLENHLVAEQKKTYFFSIRPLLYSTEIAIWLWSHS